MARFVARSCFALVGWAAAAAASPAALGACTGKDPYNPGDGIGTFHVSASLVTSTCGTAPNPWEFDVKLRHDGTTLYWVQGGGPVQGHVDATSHAVLTASASQTLRDADAQSKTPACVVTRQDSLEVALDTGHAAAADIAKADTFTGTLVYAFQPTSDSDCSDQLVASGGGFDQLPCQVSYTLGGTRTGDAK